ncbi:CPBP family glutamic-type intramembrane protease [Dyella flagellata]|uniref:CAAX prenyl protease 2/Lysostaphin resistance protein A-like domain-containing protein n=1 Tax=Dyella flagellata TaxID=1867833 RepID=A0ABQ5XF84_9GAMM|nr:CPBP family glutamic-type intramembrane protease [Dyella flagellata]GLQ90350.1 hypothetical protein GCM10007898_39250 [Dyella flagellata]
MSVSTPNSPHCKLALWLGAAGLLATVALFPYVIQLTPQKFSALHKPLWLVVSLASLETGLLCFAFAWLGLYLGASLGLDAPWLRAFVYRRPVQGESPARWRLAVLFGLLAGMVVVGASALWPESAGQAGYIASAVSQAWRGALASLYGGVVEETLCRLMLMTLFVWLLSKLRHGQAKAWMYVAAALFAALLFGGGHLSFAAALGMHAPMQIARIVLLNAMVGCVFGWLFWRHGLEHAMLAHFSADIVVHVVAPLGFS